MKLFLSIPLIFLLYNAPAQTPKAKTLYMFAEHISPVVKKNVKASGMINYAILYTHDIDTKDTVGIDSAYFISRLDILVPQKNYAGLIMIDWEGRAYDLFKTEIPNSEKFVYARQKMEGLIIWLRKLRPDAKLGNYGIPLTSYWWKTDSMLHKRNDALMPLMKKTDFLLPCLYDIFEDGSKPWLDEKGYAVYNTRASIKYAQLLKKQTYPVIWHRYHDATEKVGLLCIPEPEFAKHIKAILHTAYNKKTCNGLIWWQEDLWFAKTDKKIEKEINGRAAAEYTDNVIERYREIILKAMFGKSSKR